MLARNQRLQIGRHLGTEMMTKSYPALVHKEPGTDYRVSFPDFPGCITAGATFDEARVKAKEALAFHIEGMLKDGETLPAPSNLDAIRTDPKNRDGIIIMVIVRPTCSSQ
jgi:predicted RNase H-like HicB family nuclease